MTTLKTKDIRKMDKDERKKKIEEMKFELVKARASKSGTSKAKQIKRIIARIMTLNNQDGKQEVSRSFVKAERDKHAEVVQNK
jgi:ribosomal protein L29